jgi:hypothetical protein
LLAGQALDAQSSGLLRADREHWFASLNSEDITAIEAASFDASETGTTVTLTVVNGHFARSEFEFVHEKLPPQSVLLHKSLHPLGDEIQLVNVFASVELQTDGQVFEALAQDFQSFFLLVAGNEDHHRETGPVG